MRRLVLVLIVVFAGVVGLLLTLRAVTPKSSLVAAQLGAWRFAAHAGSPDADPYVKARVFLSGELPVASGQGFTLRAYEDSDQQALDRRCRYEVRSPFPNARYFTLTLTDREGRVVPNLVERYSFTSSEIVRREGGTFEIVIAPDPQPGNWLPTAGAGAFALDLRFYDTPLSATATQLQADSLPRITRKGCAP